MPEPFSYNFLIRLFAKPLLPRTPHDKTLSLSRACAAGGDLCGLPCAGSPWAFWGLGVCLSKSIVRHKEFTTFVNITDQMHGVVVNLPSPSLKNVHHSQSVCALSSEMEMHMLYLENYLIYFSKVAPIKQQLAPTITKVVTVPL